MKELPSGVIGPMTGKIYKVMLNGNDATRLAHEVPILGKHVPVKQLSAKYWVGRHSRFCGRLSPFMTGIYNLAALRGF
jgi:hypothetical protein